jgi:hypothetical protein
VREGRQDGVSSGENGEGTRVSDWCGDSPVPKVRNHPLRRGHRRPVFTAPLSFAPRLLPSRQKNSPEHTCWGRAGSGPRRFSGVSASLK